jgi:hypothetical protein
MEVDPTTPIHDSSFRFGRVRQHREKLEKITVRVVKVEGRRRHPGKHNRLVGRVP